MKRFSLKNNMQMSKSTNLQFRVFLLRRGKTFCRYINSNTEENILIKDLQRLDFKTYARVNKKTSLYKNNMRKE